MRTPIYPVHESACTRVQVLEEFGKEVTAAQHAARAFAERDRYAAATYAAVEAGVSSGSLAGSLVWHLTDEAVDYSAPYYGMYASHSTWGIVRGHAARLAAAVQRVAPLNDAQCRPGPS